jgi:SWI/SNF-related matrix-associated actin-dependent regulator 1 of chromatin subfamily A
MNAADLNIETLLPWGENKIVSTTKGERNLRKAEPTPEFREIWNRHRNELYAAGVTFSEWPKGSGKWQVSWWSHLTAEQIAEKNKAMDGSRATDCAIEIPKPDGLDYLGYQRAGVSFCLSSFERQVPGVLVGDEMGLGKTIQAIGIINADAKIDRVLVICPATLKINWWRELNKWLVRKRTVGIADGKTFPTTDIVIINYDVLHKWPKKLANFWDFIVIDEIHYLVNAKARRTKCVFGYRPTKKEKADGMEPTSGIPARRKIGLTGTPIINKPVDLWPIISYLNPGYWKNEWRFKQDFCGAHHNGFGWDFGGASNLDRLNRELRESGTMIRRLKADVLKDLPPKFRKVQELEPDEAATAYIRAERNEYEKAHSKRLDALKAAVEIAKASESKEDYFRAVKALEEGITVAFDEMARVRHETAVATLPMALEELKQRFVDNPGKKIIVFAHHKSVIDSLLKAYPRAACVRGGMGGEEKDKQVNRFQKESFDDCPLFVGSIRAAAEGLTLTASSHVIFFELDWTPGKMAQCEDRAHRIGQHDNVLVEIFVLRGSLSANMAYTIVEKQEIIDKALDEVKPALMAEAMVPTTVTLSSPESKQSATMTFEQVARDAVKPLPREQVAAIHTGLKILAGMCDGAQQRDDMGFNGCDTNIGHAFAASDYLSPKMAVIGRKVLLKYKRQLGEDLWKKIKGEYEDKK